MDYKMRYGPKGQNRVIPRLASGALALLYSGEEQGRRPLSLEGPLRGRPEEAPQSTDGRPWGKLINGYCPKRDDELHCSHWWDAEPCCDCYYDGPGGKED